MTKRFWCLCPACEESWVAEFSIEAGCLFATDQYGEECTDCGHPDIEVQDEYRPGDCA